MNKFQIMIIMMLNENIANHDTSWINPNSWCFMNFSQIMILREILTNHDTSWFFHKSWYIMKRKVTRTRTRTRTIFKLYGPLPCVSRSKSSASLPTLSFLSKLEPSRAVGIFQNRATSRAEPSRSKNGRAEPSSLAFFRLV